MKSPRKAGGPWDEFGADILFSREIRLGILQEASLVHSPVPQYLVVQDKHKFTAVPAEGSGMRGAGTEMVNGSWRDGSGA